MRALHEQIDNDLLQARSLQQSLVPKREQRFSGYDVSLALEPAGRVGGDLVGIFEGLEDEFGIFALDVSGHGIASALMTVRLASVLSGVGSNESIAMHKGEDGVLRLRNPAEVAARLNTIVVEEFNTELYLTLVLARIHLGSGRLTFVQAGHPHPAVQRANGSVELVGEGGLPIGLIPGAEFPEFDVQLDVGDRFFVASDGVTECANAEGTLLEDSGFADLISDLRDVRGMGMFTEMRDRLTMYSGRSAFDDDVSTVLVERVAP